MLGRSRLVFARSVVRLNLLTERFAVLQTFYIIPDGTEMSVILRLFRAGMVDCRLVDVRLAFVWSHVEVEALHAR